eukprot:TRINITY_DN25721_c0_g1_i1.p1 TRINITY_DN25721_c0_g1~~TRINITY_DN25721_c0_g1_i1.p1  ORF type:complete len:277 (+),score=30.30 TRINITY_DN25721_c0_g1_i1:113-832(+)
MVALHSLSHGYDTMQHAHVVSSSWETWLPAVSISSQLIPALIECGSDVVHALQHMCTASVLQGGEVVVAVAEQTWKPFAVATAAVMALQHVRVTSICSTDDAQEQGSWKHIAPLLFTSACALDVFLTTAVIQTYGIPLVAPLRVWALGTVLFGSPVSWIIAQVARRYGFRKGFVVELAFVAAAYVWLVWGTKILSIHPELAAQVPALFWTCFVMIIMSWSGMTCGIIFMVLLTMVLMLT